MHTTTNKVDTSGGPASSGFAGRLEGASVADLVQIECTAGRTRAIKVMSNGRSGYLCFDKGALVHAIAPGSVGDSAVLAMLSWQDGGFEPARVTWPATPTVRSAWQHLLLRAAQIADESARDAGAVHGAPSERSLAPGKLVEFPGERAKAPEPVSASREGKEAMQSQTVDLGLNEPEPIRRLVTQAVRIDGTARLLAGRGEDVETFAGVVAYGKRLADLVGDAFGMGPLAALKCQTPKAQTMIYLEESGNVVGISAGGQANLSLLDAKLGL